MSSPLQSTHAQSPSTNDMASPHIGQSGGGPLSSTGSGGSSLSSSSIRKPLSLALQTLLEGLFCTLPAGHANEGQPAINDGGWNRSHGMAFRQLLPIGRGNIHFPVI